MFAVDWITDPETGEFTWRLRPVRSEYARTDRTWNSRFAGKLAGCDLPIGYNLIRLDGHYIYGHQLAFLWMSGSIPKMIDHRDYDGFNNRWKNLREATKAQNMHNMPMPATNTSGRKGVSWHKQRGKWYAQIRAHGKRHGLGLYDDLEEAAAAYERAAAKYHGEFARTDQP